MDEWKEGMKDDDGGKFQYDVEVAWLVSSVKAECRDWRPGVCSFDSPAM